MYINKTTGASYAFKAPNIPEDAGIKTEIPCPTFEKKSVAVVSYQDSYIAEVNIKHSETVIELSGLEPEAQVVLFLMPSEELSPGAKVRIPFTDPTGVEIFVDHLSLNDCLESQRAPYCLIYSSTVGTAVDVCASVMWSGTEWIALNDTIPDVLK